VLLPAAAIAAWRERDERMRAAFRLAACWIVATVVFFSLSPAKRSVYVLTCFPALALLVGVGLERFSLASPRQRRGIYWPLIAFALLCGGAVAALPRVAARRADDVAALGPGIVAELAVILVVLALAAASAAWCARAGRTAGVVAALAAGMGLVAMFAAIRVLPRFDAVKSARGLSEVLVGSSLPGEPYAVYPRIDPSFVFYTRRFCELPAGEEELRRYVAAPGRAWLLITRRAARELSAPLPLVEVARDADERDGWLLLARPVPASGPTG
jgi:4-amino-4-deoxy-L-arabinose transferase-like glycosyltransferase